MYRCIRLSSYKYQRRMESPSWIFYGEGKGKERRNFNPKYTALEQGLDSAPSYLLLLFSLIGILKHMVKSNLNSNFIILHLHFFTSSPVASVTRVNYLPFFVPMSQISCIYLMKWAFFSIARSISASFLLFYKIYGWKYFLSFELSWLLDQVWSISLFLSTFREWRVLKSVN